MFFRRSVNIILRVVLLLQIVGKASASTSDYWVANIARQGTVPFVTEQSGTYPVYRNVQDYGATGTFIRI